MSLYAIKEYRNEVEKIIHYGGTKKETAIRNAFYVLLNKYADSKDLRLIPEISLKTKSGKIVTPDGTLKDVLRLDHGYWESKDESDDINEEIKKKFDKGYPNENILFEDSQTAVLIQQGDEVLRVPMEDEEELDKLLNRFISYQRKEVTEFREAIEHFKEDIPKVAEAIKDIIEKNIGSRPPLTPPTGENNTQPSLTERIDINKESSIGEVSAADSSPVGGSGKGAVALAFNNFLELCKASINPDITIDDVKEMMLQHILSADIFNTIFDEPHFHTENNIARELNKVVETFFTGATRRETLGRIKHYYDTINAAAAGIADHHEKQKFLKVVYENFYKAYNPKAADRLGIVYTPNEIVQFMIRSTDYLLHRHFGKTLDSKNVEILDPATGTGTFICDIIDYLPKHKLEYKYKNELHANEVAILPYYIANLNIEYVYKQKMGKYAEFENLCFVDTLDNTGFHWVGKQGDLFGVSAENAARIRKQNERKISVIIGNPPYNANQQNENDNNKNREYTEIDKRIKDTYIKKSTAQKTKAYDMYSRFYRWASDRIMDDGIIAFISNNSILNARTFDGFRKSIQDEFQFAYFIDLGGNITELSGRDGIFLNERHTIFGQAAAVGITIAFLIKDRKRKLQPCHINYIHPCDIRATRDEKLAFINSHKFEDINFENVLPDKKNNWINLTDNDFENLIPLLDKQVKIGKSKSAIFELFSLGVVTNRDEWVYDENEKKLIEKINFLIEVYNKDVDEHFGKKGESEVKNYLDYSIKWTRAVKNDLIKGKKYVVDKNRIIDVLYRPFTKRKLYYSRELNEMLYQIPSIYGENGKLTNISLIFTDANSSKPFMVGVSESIADLHYVGSGCGSEMLPLYRYTSSGERIDNITDWALELFNNHYVETEENKEIFLRQWRTIYPGLWETTFPGETLEELERQKYSLSKIDIFHYVYAVLHHPAYRKKYELNLKREFPRIPLYDNFPQWCKWGEDLKDLHLKYETVEPYPLLQKQVAEKELPKVKLKAIKESGIIQLDENTELHGIPKQAWEYKLGNRSALEWILDQYKEKKPSDPTIAEKFNTYKFSDYKEKVIDLLKRVCTVSVETMKIINQMPQL